MGPDACLGLYLGHIVPLSQNLCLLSSLVIFQFSNSNQFYERNNQQKKKSTPYSVFSPERPTWTSQEDIWTMRSLQQPHCQPVRERVNIKHLQPLGRATMQLTSET